jgi:hypothetical protein
MADVREPDIESVMAGLSEPASTGQPAARSTDPDVASVMNALEEKVPAAAPATGSAPAVQRPVTQTRFSQARAPIPAEAPEPEWSDVGRQAAQNFLPSVGGVFSAMGHAVAHPRQTVSALADLGEGAISQAAGAFGVKQDPAEKAKSEAVINALEEQYKRTYGSMKGFKKALAEDPASVLMDLSTVLTGGGTAAAKLAGAGSTAAKVAEKIATVGSAIDPVGQAITIAKGVSKVPVAIGRGAQYVATGVPTPLLEAASAAAKTSNPELNAVFKRFYSGQGTADEFQTAAQRALSQIRKEGGERYRAEKGILPNAEIDGSKIYEQIQKLEKELSQGAPSGFADKKRALEHARMLIDEVFTSPAQNARSLENIDALKRQLSDIRKNYPGDEMPIDALYTSVRDSLADPKLGGHQGYSELMEKYQQGLNNINSLVKDLSLGNKAAANASVTKALRSISTARGENLFKQLAEKDQRLPFMLSGMALNPWTAGGARNLLEGIATAPLTMIGRPDIAAGQFIASSPKIAGAINYGAGKLGKYGDIATSRGVRTPAYIGSRAQEELASEEQSQPSAAPADVAERIRKVEGEGRNPASTARGAYQIIDPTFVGAFRQMFPDQAPSMTDEEILKIRSTPEGEKLQEQMGPFLINQNTNILQQAGKEPTAANIYLMHFLGPRDAKSVLNADPSMPLEKVLPANVIAANRRMLEGKTVADLLAQMERMMAGTAATGGRIERASGGRVQNVDALVDELMGKFRKAKKETDKTTEPLLNAPDEHIVKALDVAQQAI